MEKQKEMQSIRYTAEAYVAPEYLNIADLETVDVEVPMTTKDYKVGTPDEYQVWVAVINDKEYKVPKCVIRDLQVLLAEFPKLKHFKVLKKGDGLNTSYQTIPLGV